MAKTIGFLGATTPQIWANYFTAFKTKLAGLPPIDGAPVNVIDAWAEGNATKYKEIAAQFAQQGVNAIVTSGTEPVIQARAGAPAMPIVYASAGGPIPADPKIFGTLNEQQDRNLANQRFVILKQIFGGGPGPNRKLAVLGNFSLPNVKAEADNIFGANGVGQQNQFDLLPRIDIQNPNDIAAKINALPNDVALLYVCTDPMITTNQQMIIDTAKQKSVAGNGLPGARLPTMFAFREYVARQDGGLMSFGPNFVEMFQTAAEIVHRVVGGTPLRELGGKAAHQHKLVINTQTEAYIKVVIPNPVKQGSEPWPPP